MPKDPRFTNEFFRIISGALKLDLERVRNYTAFLADQLEAVGETGTAERLRKLLASADHTLKPTEVRFSPALPVDAETRFPLIEPVRLAPHGEPPLYLNPAQWETVNEFIEVARHDGSWDPNDLDGALSLLLYGPPGTGKSRLARHIASEHGLPLYLARLDGLISSYLGSTSKNIRALFDFAARTPCILFLDEFDAIAKLRGDRQELGELKRVVNSFLQNLDTLGRQSIVLAATNHEGLLDAAVWRRFTYRLALELPTAEQRLAMWGDFSASVALTPRDLEVLADLTEGFSGSDIREAGTRLRRRAWLHPERPVQLSEAFGVVQNLALTGQEATRFATTLSGLEPAALIQTLRARDPRRYGSATLADLLNLPKARVHRLSKQGDNTHERGADTTADA